jgi:DNA-binding MarR family transcriptional regulator
MATAFPTGNPADGTEAALEAAARRYRTLAEPVRLRLLQHLNPRPRTLSVGEVAAALGLSCTAASRHVNLLAVHGFVERSRNGMYVTCRLTGMGEAIVRRALSVAVDMALDVPPLAEESAETVSLYLELGASRLALCSDRAAWDAYMVRDSGLTSARTWTCYTRR